MEEINNVNDKPSLHWSTSIHKDVERAVTRNNIYNLAGKRKAYDKVPYFYHIKLRFFLPLFIGWFCSLLNISKCYGLIRSTTIFNKKLYKYFKRRFRFAIFIHYLFGPILFFLIFLLFPLLNNPNIFDYWKQIILEFFSYQMQQQALNDFTNLILNPFFNSDTWWITLVALAAIPCLNLSALFSLKLMNPKNDKWMQLMVLDNELKMKLSNFEKGGK